MWHEWGNARIFEGDTRAAQVAILMGRAAVGCELNPDYVQIIRGRLDKRAPLFSQGG